MVLKRKTVGSKSGALVDYYAKDESIKKSSDDEASSGGNARWLGSLKQELGLETQINRDDFNSIAYGRNPHTNDRIRGVKPEGDTSERLFHDFCCSPNKSISIAALVFGMDEFIEAHNETIAWIAEHLERKYGYCRLQENGIQSNVHTGKCLFASLNHYTCRPVRASGHLWIDPQLHTHLLVMNTTFTGAVWRALQSEFMSKDKSLGFLYNQVLAQKVQRLGYPIRQVEDGFELACFADEQIEIFSKRTVEAEAHAKATGQSVHEAALELRKGKKADRTLAQLRNGWVSETEKIEVKKEIFIPLTHGTAEQELERAIAHYSARSVEFSRADIQQYVFRFVQGFSPEELEQAIITHSSLVKVENIEDRYTTDSASINKREILKVWEQGKNAQAPIIQKIPLEALLREYVSGENKIQLNESHAIAVKAILESQHQFQALKGLSKAGRPGAIAQLLLQMKLADVEVELFGFLSHEAKSELEKSLRLLSQSAESLVNGKAKSKVWVIDEAGMSSTSQWVKVLQCAQDRGAKVIFLGSTSKKTVIDAASPLVSVMRQHPETCQLLSKIIRQQNARPKTPVELILEGKGAEAIILLNDSGRVHEIGDRLTRAEAIANQFAALTDDDRDKTVVVCGNSAERKEIEAVLRQRLKDTGVLGDSIQVQILESGSVEPQMLDVAVGDRLRFTATDKKQNRYKGQQLEVFEVGEGWISAVDNHDRVHRIDANFPVSVDRDWVGTSYKHQSKPAKNAILALPSDSASSLHAVTVGISQQSLNLQVFCENPTELHRWILYSSSSSNGLGIDGSLELLQRQIDTIKRQRSAVIHKQAIADVVSAVGTSGVQGLGRGR
jgi:conjugative relaxase-like TrwC/TraI family protein